MQLKYFHKHILSIQIITSRIIGDSKTNCSHYRIPLVEASHADAKIYGISRHFSFSKNGLELVMIHHRRAREHDRTHSRGVCCVSKAAQKLSMLLYKSGVAVFFKTPISWLKTQIPTCIEKDHREGILPSMDNLQCSRLPNEQEIVVHLRLRNEQKQRLLVHHIL